MCVQTKFLLDIASEYDQQISSSIYSALLWAGPFAGVLHCLSPQVLSQLKMLFPPAFCSDVGGIPFSSKPGDGMLGCTSSKAPMGIEKP